MTEIIFNRIAIIGLGLLGSSLASILKEKEIVNEVVGYTRTSSTLAYALSEEVIDKAATSIADAVTGSDCIVICTPLGAYRKITEEIRLYVKEGMVITDVGSVKESVIKDVIPLLPEATRPFFIPAHPIAGSEKSGIKSMDPELYAGRDIIFTPLEYSNQEAVLKLEQMWEGIGAHVQRMKPDEHDQVYAQVSHLVQFIAFAFMNHFRPKGKLQDPSFKRFCRLAGSDPRMWHDIFLCNADNLSTEVKAFASALKKMAQDIKEQVLEQPDSPDVEQFTDKLDVLADRRDRIDPASLVTIVNLSIDNVKHIIPCLIGMVLVEQCKYIDKVGAGFKDVTSMVGLWQHIGVQGIVNSGRDVVNSLNGFADALIIMLASVDEAEASELEQQCVDSVLRYHSLFG